MLIFLYFILENLKKHNEHLKKENLMLMEKAETAETSNFKVNISISFICLFTLYP